MTQHLVLPPHLAIKAMRSSGYKDAAHAIAELVDNSIQAGDGLNTTTNVEVICIDRRELVNERVRSQLHQIAVYDDACGMSANTLRLALQFGAGTRLDAAEGMGKFGMGLPNASISQCKRVDVWSWQNGITHHTYLDIDEIRAGKMVEVPATTQDELPRRWRQLIASELKSHGTLVVWSELDKVNWKASRAFLRNAEMIIGRMYRYFLNEGRANIRLASYDEEFGELSLGHEQAVRPCDPLYLMSNTSAPEPFDTRPAFDSLADDEVIEVWHNGRAHNVVLRYAVASPEARGIEGGRTPLGRHAAKNIGVSVVRAERELAMEQSFNNQHDPRERWWGVEVRFDPALDDVFGVTNNKQEATHFKNIELDDDAAAEGLTPQEYREILQEDQDPRLVIYEISKAINASLKTMREQIKRYGEGVRTRANADRVVEADSPEALATKITNQRRERLGDVGKSDRDESANAESRVADLKTEFEGHLPPEPAQKLAHEYVTRNLKFWFEETQLPSSIMFDVASRAGTILIKLNTSHPLTENLYSELEKHQAETGPAYNALKLMIMAWARMEDEATEQRRETLEDIRGDWGKIARDYIKGLKE